MAKSAKDELLARINADIKRLEAMRDYVTTNAVEGTETPKVRKARGPGKKKAGLPDEPTHSGTGRRPEGPLSSGLP